MDVSEAGWAAALFANGARFHTFRFWSVIDSSFTSNQRETSAVLRGLTYFRRLLKHIGTKAMTVRSDNGVTACNLQRQGANMALLQLTKQIFKLL
jgi:ribonuclease HI